MRDVWQSLLEHLWPSRSGSPAGQERRTALLQAGIALAIALAAGPEVFAAMEMTALLELLGASLFLTAFAAGAKLTAASLWRATGDILLPAAQLFVIRSDAAVPAKAQALIYCTVNAACWLLGVVVFGAWAHMVIQLAS